MTWAARLATASRVKPITANRSDSADSDVSSPIGAIGPIGTEKKSEHEADAIEAAYLSEERAAIQCSNAPRLMPVSWADPLIEPTAGARCRNCTGSTWWTEVTRPKGWRCGRCHPGDHLPADRRRDLVT